MAANVDIDAIASALRLANSDIAALHPIEVCGVIVIIGAISHQEIKIHPEL